MYIVDASKQLTLFMENICDFTDLGLSSDYLVPLLEESSDSFDPPLTQRIVEKSGKSGVLTYIEKLLSHGHILVNTNNGVIDAFVAYYSNDKETRLAYIPLVLIKKESQGKGLATTLINECLNRLVKDEMNAVTIKTWKTNYAAIALYKKLGFSECHIDDNDITLIFKINL